MNTSQAFKAALAEGLRTGRIEAFEGPDGETRYRLGPKELRATLKRFLQYPREMDLATALAWARDGDTLQRAGLLEPDTTILTPKAWQLAGRWIERWCAVRDSNPEPADSGFASPGAQA